MSGGPKWWIQEAVDFGETEALAAALVSVLDACDMTDQGTSEPLQADLVERIIRGIRGALT